jgi:hypothetical protein
MNMGNSTDAWGQLMRLRTVLAAIAVTILTAGTSRADFKYTQQSKVTGGALVGVTKTLGVFSKNARQATAPQLSTTMVRNNQMRTEQATGTVEIIDLEGKRFIHVDTVKKSYWIQTFDQFRQQMEQAREKMKAEQAKTAAKHGDAQSVALDPKFDMQATGQTRTVLDIPAKEMKMRVDMLFKSTDPKTEADLEKSNPSFWMTADSWYGTIPGYEEVRDFYMKMAKELDWLPGSVGMANPQRSQATEEFKKNAIKMDGMPLVQYTSFGMMANEQAGDGQSAGGQAEQKKQPQTPPPSNDNSTPTSTKEAISKQLGGLFGKKKQQQQSDSASTNSKSSNGTPQPAAAAGSLMDMTIEVTSYSKDRLDASLFDVPAGYTQVPNPNAR